MKLNCKPGDLAVIVRSCAGNEGKIVRCVRYLGLTPWHGPDYISRLLPTWEIDRVLQGFDGRKWRGVIDAQLRPIHDNPGTDETLTWLDVPTKEAA